MRRKNVNFIFGIVVGASIALFATNPSTLGNVLHWAGDHIEQQDAIKLPGVN